MNSFKMKLAIVLGVSHMMFGILLRGLNSIFARKALDFVFEFVPMIIFMSVTFGYMAVLIMLKWSIPWDIDANYPSSKAPSIITIFIKMALKPGGWDDSVGLPLYGDLKGELQANVQLVFLITAMICADLILWPKPIILICRQKTAHKHQARLVYQEEQRYNPTENLLERHDDNQTLIPASTPASTPHENHGDQHEESAGDIFVHQIIETIEFVLGSISNTASYLRLWALSLAHSQLAKVFFDNTLKSGITSGSFITIFIGYWLFGQVTFGVLILMDQMECFLHALRLHWVEFQNKFYKADGYAFKPFSFEKALRKD